jgi:hypothetical protein
MKDCFVHESNMYPRASIFLLFAKSTAGKRNLGKLKVKIANRILLKRTDACYGKYRMLPDHVYIVIIDIKQCFGHTAFVDCGIYSECSSCGIKTTPGHSIIVELNTD